MIFLCLEFFFSFDSLQGSLLCIVGSLQGEGLCLSLMALMIGDRGHMAHDR